MEELNEAMDKLKRDNNSLQGMKQFFFLIIRRSYLFFAWKPRPTLYFLFYSLLCPIRYALLSSP